MPAGYHSQSLFKGTLGCYNLACVCVWGGGGVDSGNRSMIGEDREGGEREEEREGMFNWEQDRDEFRGRMR